MSCPKCGNVNFVSAGTYSIKRTNIPIQRMRCKDCGVCFTLRTSMFHKKVPIKLRKKVLKLWKTRKYNTSKFDSHRKRTYSTRDIARMLKVSKSFVWDVIKGGEGRWKKS